MDNEIPKLHLTDARVRNEFAEVSSNLFELTWSFSQKKSEISINSVAYSILYAKAMFHSANLL